MATGAPYSGPNKEGAIYIFRGGPNGIDEFPSQVILARNVDPKIRGFGFSVSGSVDLDGNGYPGVGVIKLFFCIANKWAKSGNTKGGSITVPLTSCLTGLELAV